MGDIAPRTCAYAYCCRR